MEGVTVKGSPIKSINEVVSQHSSLTLINQTEGKEE